MGKRLAEALYSSSSELKIMQQSRKIYKQDLILEVGYVYVMTNEHIPNLIKIGMTTRTPTERSSELSSTGVPGRFSVEYSIFVPNCEQIEKRVHKALQEFRLSEDREFFKVEISTAIEVIEKHANTMVEYFPGWPNLEIVNEFIQGELARIKGEDAKRLEQYRLEKQARSIELEIERKQREAQAKQEIIDRSRQELERVDSTTKSDIEQSYIRWNLLLPTIFFIIAMVHSNERAVLIAFWMGVLTLTICIYLTWSEKNSAVILRKKWGLPDL
jgi:hypothetical protein